MYTVFIMKRGIVKLNNQELVALNHLLNIQDDAKPSLLQKLQPVTDVSNEKEHKVQISEEDAELLLDCMPIPGKETDLSIKTARMKIQQFLAYSRFGE